MDSHSNSEACRILVDQELYKMYPVQFQDLPFTIVVIKDLHIS